MLLHGDGVPTGHIGSPDDIVPRAEVLGLKSSGQYHSGWADMTCRYTVAV